MLDVILVLLPMALSFLALSTLLYLSLRREPTDLNEIFSFMISFILIMNISFILELLYDTQSIMLVWNFTYYIGFLGALACIIVFSMKVLDMRYWMEYRHLWIFLVIPVLCLFLVLTDPFLGLYYDSIAISQFGPFSYLNNQPGPGFYLFIAFGIFLVLFLLHALIKDYFSALKPNQDAIMVLLLVPIILNMNFFTIQFLGQPLPSTYSFMVIVTIMVTALYFLTRHMERRVSSPTYSQVLQNLETGIVVLDMEDRVQYVNPEATKHLQLNKGDPLPSQLQNVVISHLDDITNREIDFDVDGELRYFDTKIKNLHDHNGACKARLVIMNDITEQVRVRNDLLRMQEKMTLLSSITKHDIVNQLSVILGYGELLREHPGIDENCSLRLDAIMRAAESIRMQTEFMHDYQNVGRNLPQWYSLAKLAHLAFEQMDTNGIRFTFNGRDVEIHADPMIQKVFMNLIGNTVQHSERASRVSVDVEVHGEDLKIVYTDDGVGIAEDEKELVFQSDFGKGSGLGLFLSRTILNMTGMEIHEEGVSGEGVRFVIWVPPGSYRFPDAS
jgi:signal transduction histidine kinase